jgi:hypothetical protein
MARGASRTRWRCDVQPSVELNGIDYDVLISFRQDEDGFPFADFAVWQMDREPEDEGGFSNYSLDADSLARLLRGHVADPSTSPSASLRAELRAGLGAMETATEGDTALKDHLSGDAQAGSKRGGGHWIEHKMINGCGPYAYERWFEGAVKKSRYIGKVREVRPC